jgi:hypothetical protein
MKNKLNRSNIIAIIPATGWTHRYLSKGINGQDIVVEEPIICFAIFESFTNPGMIDHAPGLLDECGNLEFDLDKEFSDTDLGYFHNGSLHGIVANDL